jgi:hypothetical protein
MTSRIGEAKRVPAKLPFVMRTSKAKAALMLLVVGVVVEPVLAVVVAVDDPAEELGFWPKQVILVALLVLCWFVLSFRKPTFGLDGTGVWVQLASQSKTYTVFVPWSEIARVEQVRNQWQTSLGLSLRDPSVLEPERLKGALSRRAILAVGATCGEAEKTHPPCHLHVSLTTANRSVAEVGQSLSRYAPPHVQRHLELDPAGLSPGDKAARAVGRVVLGVAWIGLFLAGISALVWALFDVGPDTVAGKIVAFASASAGGATLSWAYGRYERFLARRAPVSTRDDRP